MAIGYDEKVWRMIRELWEVSPKSASVQSILNQVSDLLCCDVPSAPTVHVKMKKEQWRKLSQKELRERAKMPTNKSANKANNISRKKDEKNIDKSSGNADLISSTELSKKGANKSVENDLELLEHAGKTPSEALQLVNNVLDSWSLISSYDATAQKQAHVPEPPIR